MQADRKALLLIFLCSSCTSAVSTDAGTTASSDATSDAASVNDSASTAESGTSTDAGKPETPEMVSVVQMAGNLHTRWKLNDSDLTGVELWRKKDGGEFALAYTLPGTAVDLHDGQAVAPGTYCYHVITVRGSGHSDASPDKCGSP